MKKFSPMNDPEYKQALEKLHALRREREDLRIEAERLENQRHPPNTLREEAESFLLGGVYEAPRDTVSEKIQEIYRRRSVLYYAIEMQEKLVEKNLSRVSAEVCQAIRGDYASAVKKVADLVKKLDAAREEEYKIREGVLDEGLAFASHINPVVLHNIGYLRDPNSRVSQFLKEAEEAGYI